MRVSRFSGAVLLVISTYLSFTQAAFAQQIITTHGSGGTLIGSIDPSTGVGTNIGASGQTQAWALTIDTDGTWFTTYNGFSGDAQLAIVNPSTGAIASTIGGLGVSLIALEIDASGQMWGVGYGDQNLYRIDKATAATTLVGSTGLSNMMDLSISSAGVLYGVVSNNLYTLDTGTGASTLVTAITGVAAGEIMGIMHDASDNLFGTAYVSASPLYSINATSGVASVVGATGFIDPHGGDIRAGASPVGTPTPVPTLSEYMLALLSLLVVLMARPFYKLRSR